MKLTLQTILAAFSVMVIGSSFVYAEDKAPPAGDQSHEQHHPEGQAKETAKDSGMMGSMKMDDMMGMMHQCMSMHKDGKRCDHETMEKCQANMGKGDDCQKMMKQMKAKEKSKAKN